MRRDFQDAFSCVFTAQSHARTPSFAVMRPDVRQMADGWSEVTPRAARGRVKTAWLQVALSVRKDAARVQAAGCCCDEAGESAD
jgi:hypothetical protein